MLTQHSGLESPTHFIAITNYECADMKGKKMGLIIAGDQTSVWLKMAKELLKDKKLLETGTTNFDFEKFISTLHSKFKLKDLIADY